LRAEATEARIDGFGAKAAIHPKHCDVINDAFHPSDSEIEWATAVLQALKNSKSFGGVATLFGKMIDRPHVEQARRILDQVESGYTG
jgi:citrate lyase subunit beta / citryl-CoA lyase